MPKSQKLLVIGPTAPSRAPAAGICTQAALYFSTQAAVTIVISDYAPPPKEFPDSIKVIRERDLRRATTPYKNAKRFYVLDDTHESLFALRLLQQAPGPWINADTTLHNLVHTGFRAGQNYPDDYLSYMEKSLGNPGWKIGHSLSGEMRISKNIASEITSFDFLKSFGDQLVQSNAKLQLPLAPTVEELPPYHNGENDCFEIVTIGEGAIHDAIETLKALEKPVTLVALSGSEPDLAALINSADAVCLIDENHRLPPAALTLALSMGKAIITANQPWVRLLPQETRLNIPHAYALHHLVAAISSLLGKNNIGAWLAENAIKYTESETSGGHAKTAAKILSSKNPPLALSAGNAGQIEETPKAIDDTEGSDVALLPSGGQNEPYALIGGVPAQALVNQLFPTIDWQKSPRFATPELAAVLSRATGKPPAVILALLGYESLLVHTADSANENGNTPHMPSAYDWAHIRTKLKTSPQAITFDCDIEGLPKVRSLTPQDAIIPGGLVIDFSSDVHEDVKRQKPSGFLEKSGTYWQLNKLEHRIDCLLISGVPGGYRLSVGPMITADTPTDEAAFMVADDQNSSLLTRSTPAVVKTDSHGVIQFSLSAAHPVNFYPLTFDQLLKSLATSPLYLEWYSNG